MNKISYQGEIGSYSEGAILKYLGNDVVKYPKKIFEDVFKSVMNDECDYALIPIENSLGGSLHVNYDLILEYKNLNIVAEYNYKIEHNLLVYPGTEFRDIENVISHHQAIAQCKEYLKSKNLNYDIRYDTAGSAKYIAEYKIKDMATIASKIAAEKYGLEILDSNIEDSETNYTRFLLLSKKKIEFKVDVNYKTSIVFSLSNHPGVLFKALAVFFLRDIDLTKIESRPDRKKSSKKYDYLFYLDFICPRDDTFENAINHLKEMTTFLRILGSYPAS